MQPFVTLLTQLRNLGVLKNNNLIIGGRRFV
jgi:hypothetical protein